MFEIASGSVLGRDHVGPGKNNQDAVWVERELGCASVDGRPLADQVVAVVCDGCGSGDHSEVGAKIGARLVTANLVQKIREKKFKAPSEGASFGDGAKLLGSINEFLRRVQDDVLAQIRVLALGMGGSLTATVQDYFLFTVVGAVVTQELAFVFGCGDGVAIMNGLDLKIGLKDGSNAPPYLGYHLVGQGRDNLAVKGVLPLSEFRTLVIASDGLMDLFADQHAKLPGKTEKVGFVSRLWEDDRFFSNKDGLRRFLALANKTSESFDWKAQTVKREHGLLKDDTSVVVIRDAGK